MSVLSAKRRLTLNGLPERIELNRMESRVQLLVCSLLTERRDGF